jgi:hypothetical protein
LRISVEEWSRSRAARSAKIHPAANTLRSWALALVWGRLALVQSAEVLVK